MVAAGIPLVQALEITASGTEKLSMKALVLAISKDVTAGCAFAEALQKHPRYFNRLICSLVNSGETSGTLDTVLDQIAGYLERLEVLKRRIKKAMYYPIIMLTVTLVVAVILLGFVVPQFAELYHSFGAQLPGPTRVVIGLSNFLKNFWWLILILSIAAGFTFITLKQRSKKFKRFLDRLAIRIFIFGPVIRKAILARISRTLEITLGAGIPLVDALRGVAGVANNSVYSDAVLQVREDITSGKQMYVAMSATKLFPSMMLQMIGVGEKSGALEKMLSKIADFFDDEVETTVDGLSTLLEPIMLIMLGIIIGGFVISMYLPIFRLGMIL